MELTIKQRAKMCRLRKHVTALFKETLMKKTTKTIAIMAAMAVFTTAGLFAQPKPADNGARPVIERPEGLEFKDAKTIAVSVKVVNKKVSR